MAEAKIEVFQDLHLGVSKSNRTVLRSALIGAATTPWRHNAVQEKKMIESAGVSDDVIMFKRDKSDGIDAVELSLWSDNGGFKVSNIVPCELGSLGEYKYNLALQDFVDRVANRAAEITQVDVKVSRPKQGLDDWLTPDAAKALRQFSYAANKSTGSMHPADQRRWFEFLITAHRARLYLATELLLRWFIEVEDWSQDIAQELCSEYSFASELLLHYDSNTELSLEQRQIKQQTGDRFDPTADEALRQFSDAANKFTGSSHPADLERWLTFLLSVNQSRISVDAEVLTKWLISVEQWPDDIARELVNQYEFGLDLLQQYEAKSP